MENYLGDTNNQLIRWVRFVLSTTVTRHPTGSSHIIYIIFNLHQRPYAGIFQRNLSYTLSWWPRYMVQGRISYYCNLQNADSSIQVDSLVTRMVYGYQYRQVFYHTLSPKQKTGTIKIGNTPLKNKDEETYLGIMSDKKQTWTPKI